VNYEKNHGCLPKKGTKGTRVDYSRNQLKASAQRVGDKSARGKKRWEKIDDLTDGSNLKV
jgi:hypothetical protein